MENSSINMGASLTDKFIDLDRLPVYGALQQLAQQAVDLSVRGVLTHERIAGFVCRGGGFDLLYATQQVDVSVIEALQQLADQGCLIEKFLAMKQGAVLNKIEGFASENRQILHTSCRDVFSENPQEPAASVQAQKELGKLRVFLDELESNAIVNQQGEPFTDLVHIGIGGSDLGPRAVYLALAAFRHPARRIHFISNVDPDDAAAVLRSLDLSKTLVAVVSKSGTTLETNTNEELARQAFRNAGLDPRRHFLAVTGEGSPMDNPEHYLRSFYMFDYIGGRYSATSMVGGVMLAFALGFEAFTAFLRGAHGMDVVAEEPDIRKNPALMLALLGIWNRNFLGHQTVAVLPYSQALIRFAAHLQQCDMESNGKSTTRQGRRVRYQTGPIVWGEPGTNGQHAFYQLLHQGTVSVPAEFIGFRHNQYDKDITVNGSTSQEKLVANMLAQALALATGKEDTNPNRVFPGNRPSTVLIADRLTPETMGALLALYEAKVVFQGFAWNINSFDQEGVQLGKVLATRLLDIITGQQQLPDTTTADNSIETALLVAAGIKGLPKDD